MVSSKRRYQLFGIVAPDYQCRVKTYDLGCQGQRVLNEVEVGLFIRVRRWSLILVRLSRVQLILNVIVEFRRSKWLETTTFSNRFLTSQRWPFTRVRSRSSGRAEQSYLRSPWPRHSNRRLPANMRYDDCIIYIQLANTWHPLVA